MLKLNEVLIVEGKSDTINLKKYIEADIIETNGSALSKETIELIVKISQKREIIIFTDPDFNGERLRKKITEKVPNAKHAFLTKIMAGELIKHHSLGVEYANEENIIEALTKVYTKKIGIKKEYKEIEMQDLIKEKLIGYSNSVKKRNYVTEKLNIGYVNGKQLLKRLKMFNIKRDDFYEILNQYKE